MAQACNHSHIRGWWSPENHPAGMQSHPLIDRWRVLGQSQLRKKELKTLTTKDEHLVTASNNVFFRTFYS